MHLDLHKAVAGAGLTASALCVEGEPPLVVAAQPRVLGGGEEVPDVVKQARIGRGVGPGRPSDGTLVQRDHLVDKVQALDAVILSRMYLGPVLFRRQDLVENLLNQGGLPAPGHAGDTDQFSQGEAHVDSLQVVLRRAADDELMSVPLPAYRGDGDLLSTAEILAGDRLGAGTEIVHRSRADHLSAVDAGARADVDDMVRRAHGLFVMLHHNQGISQVAQPVQGLQELCVVSLVQADAGFVQDIQHAHQAGPDLGRQTDPLALAAREGPRGAGEGQIAEAHAAEKLQPAADLFDDLGRDQLLLRGEGQAVQEFRRVHHREPCEFGDVFASHRHGQGRLLQALPSAGGAGCLGHAGFDLRPHSGALGLAVAPFQVRDNSLEFSFDDAVAVRLFIAQLQRLALRPVEDRVDCLRRKGLDGVGELEMVLLRHRVEVHLGDAVRLDVSPARGVDAAVFDAELAVGHDELGINQHLNPEARAGRAGPVGVVEGKQPRGDLFQ